MPHPRKDKKTAAYAASQPLFDALRVGVDRCSEQKIQLAVARDLCRNIHVKLPNVDNHNELQHYQRYIRASLNAFTIAAEAYVGIFDALAAVTAADPTEGRDERDGYKVFAALADLLKQARGTTMAYDSERQAAAMAQHAGLNGTNSVNAKAGTSPQSTTLESRKRPHSDGSASKADGGRSRKIQKLSESVERSEPVQTAGDGLADARRPHKKLEKSGRRKSSRHPAEVSLPHRSSPTRQQGHGLDVQSQVEGNVEAAKVAGLMHVANIVQHEEPGVDYEDISSVVDARLKAKEERRRAKDKEKKRKRKSDVSLNEVEAEELHGRKRSKSDAGSADHVRPSGIASMSTATKKHMHPDEDDGAGMSRRKRRNK